MLTGFEVKDHVQKQETPNSLPAPPQMPLPEIPQPWLVSEGSPQGSSRAPGPRATQGPGQVITARVWGKGGLVLLEDLLRVVCRAASGRLFT